MNITVYYFYVRSDVNIHIDEAWTTIDRLSTIWKSDL